MPKFNVNQESFLGGELSPLCDMRTELDNYKQGASELTNFLVNPAGPAVRRCGTKWVKTCESGTTTRLIPFVFSQNESYVVEFTGSIGAGSIKVINVLTGSTATLGTSSANKAYYDLVQVQELQVAQSADVMWIVHGDVMPQILVRTAVDTFELRRWTYDAETAGSPQAKFVRWWPFRDPNTSSITMTPNSSGAATTLTASSAYFTPGMVGALFRVTSGSGTAWCQITGGTSTVATIHTLVGFESGSWANWSESAWSDYRGWPRTITFFENRLIYGGNTAQPDTFWGSQAENYNQMMAQKFSQDSTEDSSGIGYFGSLTNSDAISYTVSSQTVNQIQWMSGKGVLIIGTASAEHVVFGPDQNLGIGALNIGTREQTNHGGILHVPSKALNGTFFITKDGRIREFLFYYDSDSYEAEDISKLFYPIRPRDDFSFGIGASEIYWSETDQTLYVLIGSGKLFAVHRDRRASISAWSYQRIAGTDLSIQSMCVVPNNGYDEVWICASRTINGSTARYIERFAPPYSLTGIADYTDEFSPEAFAPYYLDSAIFKDLESVTTEVTGITTLAGETVDIIGDGVYLGQHTVSSDGDITLNSAARYVVIGLRYRSKLKTMKINAGSAIGSSRGSIMRIDRASVSLYRTIGAKIGSSDNDMETLTFNDPSLSLDAPIPIFTGEKTVDFMSNPEREAYVQIVQDLPFPMTVLGISMRGETRDA